MDDDLRTDVVESDAAGSLSIELGSDFRRASRRREARLMCGSGLLSVLSAEAAGGAARSSNCPIPGDSHSSGTEPRLGGRLTGPRVVEERRCAAGSARRTIRSLDAEEGLLGVRARRGRAKSRGVGDCAAALWIVRRVVLELTVTTGATVAEGLLLYPALLETPRMLMGLGDDGAAAPEQQLTRGDVMWTADETLRRLEDEEDQPAMVPG